MKKYDREFLLRFQFDKERELPKIPDINRLMEELDGVSSKASREKKRNLKVKMPCDANDSRIVIFNEGNNTSMSRERSMSPPIRWKPQAHTGIIRYRHQCGIRKFKSKEAYGKQGTNMKHKIKTRRQKIFSNQNYTAPSTANLVHKIDSGRSFKVRFGEEQNDNEYTSQERDKLHVCKSHKEMTTTTPVDYEEGELIDISSESEGEIEEFEVVDEWGEVDPEAILSPEKMENNFEDTAKEKQNIDINPDITHDITRSQGNRQSRKRTRSPLNNNQCFAKKGKTTSLSPSHQFTNRMHNGITSNGIEFRYNGKERQANRREKQRRQKSMQGKPILVENGQIISDRRDEIMQDKPILVENGQIISDRRDENSPDRSYLTQQDNRQDSSSETNHDGQLVPNYNGEHSEGHAIRQDSSADTQAHSNTPFEVYVTHERYTGWSEDFRNIIAKKVLSAIMQSQGKSMNIDEIVQALEHAENLRFQEKANLVDLIYTYGHVFHILKGHGNDIVIPKTNMRICTEFTNGKMQCHGCKDLHICKFYLIGECNLSRCKFGHTLRSEHNKSVLNSHMLLDLSDNEIKLIAQNIQSRNDTTVPIVCRFYNNAGGCKEPAKCPFVHICKYYVLGECKYDSCKRSHDLTDDQPKRVLKMYGLPTHLYGDTILRDILLKSICASAKRCENREDLAHLLCERNADKTVVFQPLTSDQHLNPPDVVIPFKNTTDVIPFTNTTDVIPFTNTTDVIPFMNTNNQHVDPFLTMQGLMQTYCNRDLDYLYNKPDPVHVPYINGSGPEKRPRVLRYFTASTEDSGMNRIPETKDSIAKAKSIDTAKTESRTCNKGSNIALDTKLSSTVDEENLHIARESITYVVDEDVDCVNLSAKESTGTTGATPDVDTSNETVRSVALTSDDSHLETYHTVEKVRTNSVKNKVTTLQENNDNITKEITNKEETVGSVKAICARNNLVQTCCPTLAEVCEEMDEESNSNKQSGDFLTVIDERTCNSENVTTRRLLPSWIPISQTVICNTSNGITSLTTNANTELDLNVLDVKLDLNNDANGNFVKCQDAVSFTEQEGIANEFNISSSVLENEEQNQMPDSNVIETIDAKELDATSVQSVNAALCTDEANEDKKCGKFTNHYITGFNPSISNVQSNEILDDSNGAIDGQTATDTHLSTEENFVGEIVSTSSNPDHALESASTDVKSLVNGPFPTYSLLPNASINSDTLMPSESQSQIGDTIYSSNCADIEGSDQSKDTSESMPSGNDLPDIERNIVCHDVTKVTTTVEVSTPDGGAADNRCTISSIKAIQGENEFHIQLDEGVWKYRTSDTASYEDLPGSETAVVEMMFRQITGLQERLNASM